MPCAVCCECAKSLTRGAYIYVECRGSRAQDDPVVDSMLHSGVVQPPPEDE